MASIAEPILSYLGWQRDAFLLVWRGLSWTAWRLVTNSGWQQADSLRLSPSSLRLAPREILELAVLPKCIEQMLRFDGLSPPSYDRHIRGLSDGGELAAQIVAHVKRHGDASAVLRKLQGAEQIDGIDTALLTRTKCGLAVPW